MPESESTSCCHARTLVKWEVVSETLKEMGAQHLNKATHFLRFGLLVQDEKEGQKQEKTCL